MRARDNPFRADRVLRLRYRFSGTNWEALLRRLSTFHNRAAIVGPEGSGKTTLLEEFEEKLIELGFRPKPLRLDQANPRFACRFLRDFFAQLDPGDFVLLDGAEQLTGLAWFWFKRKARLAGGLLITTHLPGRLPTLLECSTTPALFRQITEELAGPFGLESDVVNGELFGRHAGNIRNALRELYDRLAGI